MERLGSQNTFAIDMGSNSNNRGVVSPSSTVAGGGVGWRSASPSSSPLGINTNGSGGGGGKGSLQLPKRRYLAAGAFIIGLCLYFAIHIGVSVSDLDAVHERGGADVAHEHPFKGGDGTATSATSAAPMSNGNAVMNSPPTTGGAYAKRKFNGVTPDAKKEKVRAASVSAEESEAAQRQQAHQQRQSKKEHLLEGLDAVRIDAEAAAQQHAHHGKKKAHHAKHGGGRKHAHDADADAPAAADAEAATPSDAPAAAGERTKRPSHDDRAMDPEDLKSLLFVAGQKRPLEDGELAAAKASSPSSMDIIDQWSAKALEVRAEMLDCWNAYRKYAWGHDQLRPISKQWNDWSANGNALTIVDALGTLWLMGSTEEFMDGMRKVTEEVDWDSDVTTSVFESTIRIVGGLVSAYEISGEQFPQLLATAKRVGDILLWSYNTSSGLPHQTIHFKSRDHWNAGWSSGSSILADMGSSTIEFRTLSYHTKDPIYDIKATHVNSVLTQRSKRDSYMASVWWDPDTGAETNNLKTLGAYGDSYFEYMLKQYLLTNRTDAQHKAVAEAMLGHVLRSYVRTSPDGSLTWLTDSSNTKVVEHLLCFTGGMFALASWSLPDSPKAKEFLKLGDGLGNMCYQMYARNVNGIAPDAVIMRDAGSQTQIHTSSGKFILRPETVESLFYLWRVTKDEKYRNMAYAIFTAIRKHCKRKETGGYTGLHNVDENPLRSFDDDQQTFFLAETLKYLYLTFADELKLPLTQWVFNTEGHPVRIRHRDPLDIWRQWEEDHGGEPAFFPPTVSGVDDVETRRMRIMRGGKKIVAPHDSHSYRIR